jgi:4-diphosphocytidyl-2-C-methyl-D-erythritol kinase
MLGLSPLPQRDVLLVTPDFRVPTPEAYEWIDADRPDHTDHSHDSASDLLLITEEMLASWLSVAALSRNDFIPSVTERHPRLRVLLDTFKETGSFLSSMSGAGSTLFGVYDVLPDASALPAFEGTTIKATRTADKVVQPVRIG